MAPGECGYDVRLRNDLMLEMTHLFSAPLPFREALNEDCTS
jgi:hypothetical protein